MSPINFQPGPPTSEPGSQSPQPRQTATTPRPTAQTRSDFNAALRRAGQNTTGSDDVAQPDSSSDSDPLDQPEQQACPNLMTPLGGLAQIPLMPPMPPGATMTAQATSTDGIQGGSAMTAVPTKANSGTLPDAVPMTPGANATVPANTTMPANPVNPAIAANATNPINSTGSTGSTNFRNSGSFSNSIASADQQQWQIDIPADDSASAMAVRLVNAGSGHWQVRLAADSATRQQLMPNLGRLRDKLRQRSGDRVDDVEFDGDVGLASSTEAQTQL